jgi:hypothetical protein
MTKQWTIFPEQTDKNYIIIGTGEGIKGCILLERHTKGSDSEDMPNAKLIASAPELLEALKNLINTAKVAMRDANRDGAGFDVNAELEEARAAIEKAEGDI